MALLQEWQKISYNQEQDRASLQKFWQNYFLIEKGIFLKTKHVQFVSTFLSPPDFVRHSM